MLNLGYKLVESHQRWVVTEKRIKFKRQYCGRPYVLDCESWFKIGHCLASEAGGHRHK